jgi:cell division transport system ATP-binding protein
VHYSSGVDALQDINLRINDGEFVFIVGESGAGKSTLMKLLLREIEPSSGRVFVNGHNLARTKGNKIAKFRRSIGVVFQDFQLLVDRNVEENLMFVLKATGWKDKHAMKSNIHDVLKQVGMAEKAYKMPYQLSGGEQQRVVIARALLNAPSLILADEPTGNLDPETGKEIMDLLYSIAKAGMTVMMSTHNHTWPDQYPGRKLVFADGRIQEG